MKNFSPLAKANSTVAKAYAAATVLVAATQVFGLLARPFGFAWGPVFLGLTAAGALLVLVTGVLLAWSK